MPLPVLICDDSRLARRQMARSLPAGWDIDLSFAEQGAEAIELIRQGKGDLMFLDLNMPVMNGYEVLETIRKEDLPTMVLVVSGDIQTEARNRVMSLGALDFVRKPVSPDIILDVLARYGIYDRTQQQITDQNDAAPAQSDFYHAVPKPDFLESLREVTNIAMGQAGSHLGDVLQTFIRLPVPQVFLCPYQDVVRYLGYSHGELLSAVSHGFSSNHVAGEGIVIVESSRLADLRRFIGQASLTQQASNAGIMTDLSELLVGSCLKGISQQLDIDFNHSYPVLLGHNMTCAELLNSHGVQTQVLAINITYDLQEPDVTCHLLLVMTEDSLPTLTSRVSLISSDSNEVPQ